MIMMESIELLRCNYKCASTFERSDSERIVYLLESTSPPSRLYEAKQVNKLFNN